MAKKNPFLSKATKLEDVDFWIKEMATHFKEAEKKIATGAIVILLGHKEDKSPQSVHPLACKIFGDQTISSKDVIFALTFESSKFLSDFWTPPKKK